MADLTEVQKDLQTLAAGLKQLEAEYNMFFSGRTPRPPWETRHRVAALVKKWDRGYIQAAADRFMFDNLQRRFMKLLELWDRGVKSREEGRGAGPFGQAPPKAPRQPPAEQRILHVTTFQDPMREMDKLHSLYDSLMDARRESGDEVVPFHRFAALVKDQVEKVREDGAGEVAFRVTMADGKVNFTVRGKKESGEG
jgi:hypothetical protein